MNGFTDCTYWIAVAHLPGWHTERINRFIVQVVHEKQMAWSEFFGFDKQAWRKIFAFSNNELADIESAKNDLPRLAFIAEQLQNEGFHIITLNSPGYPAVLKENLKMKGSPPLLYIKGRKGLLQEDAIAIVGSRSAGKIALDFTDRVARRSSEESKIVVSGFAKGVDRQALDSAIAAHGKSIIVLPQGILTFQSGFKKYYKSIVNGDLLVLSAFFPKAGWDVGLAMARNAYIYGLAGEIYVAETDSKGGTWEGAMDGLRRHRTVYVRIPEPGEKNANRKLIDLGAVPVSMDGVVMNLGGESSMELFEQTRSHDVKDPEAGYDNAASDYEKKIIEFLKHGAYTSKEIRLALKIDWDARKLAEFLRKNPNVKAMPGKPVKFTRNDVVAGKLF